MRRPFFGLFVISVALGGVAFGQALPGKADLPRVIPHPQIEDYGRGTIRVAKANTEVSILSDDTELLESKAFKAGMALLSKRLDRLSGVKLGTVAGSEEAQLLISKSPEQDMTAILRDCGAKCNLPHKRLMQAYVLECTASKDGIATIAIQACSGQGIYYAFVSLCQLFDRGARGEIVAPIVKIADWPEIGLRLAKTSASTNPLPYLQRYADWMPLYKINVMGLQFHGSNSKQPGVFLENVTAICSAAEEGGVLETIVYFCPFRGKPYDFNSPADREKYVELLQWMLAQGADGVEVDYNDWPGEGVPIEEVINLACEAVAEKNPEAYILYCPPNRGASQYRGPASAEMQRILSKVPAKVWPLWTGMATLIEKPLKVEQVEQWTRQAGRRPFLWVNRVSPRVDRAFAQTVQEVPGALVFRGNLLPDELDRLFEGVHFNAGFSSGCNDLPEDFSVEALAYMATAADYVWNPTAWEAAESARRAQRFVSIMLAAGPAK